ncbi:S8 family peptidase [Streptomyces sp. NPDC096136]|uniref:S8 family peptidase n=1 Tax=Streptomyces sp. NPDC096136 TaxID=3366076 RepID=UPI0038120A4B
MRLLARVAAAALLAVPPVAAGTASAAGPEPTPVPLHTSAAAIPGRYIVTLEKGYDAAKRAKDLGLKPTFVYQTVLNGFAAPLTRFQLDLVRLSPGVKAVEEDATASAPPTPVGSPGTRAPAYSWGLDRIDQRRLPLDNDFTTQGNGAGVTAYIIDTGIETAHAEFGGRATAGFDAIGDGRAGQDCNGHGTHVAGTVGGSTYGVARKVNLVSVRVLNCESRGAWSGIIAGFDWVARNARQPAVANASLGGDFTPAVNDAATALSDSGVLPVVAAGNSAKDACTVSPASASRVYTVGATDRYDQETDFSNYGRCLSGYAPGKDIVSARLGGGSVALNGTSMAAPHVAGVAALYKAAHPTETAQQVGTWLYQTSTKDVLGNLSPGSPNSLLFTGGL